MAPRTTRTEEDRATRSRMLLATAELLQTQGYHGTGLNQILTDAGAPRGSMYHHFPGGKEQLAVEALQKSQAWVSRAVHAAFQRGGRNVRAGLREFIEAFAKQLERSDFAQGCPVATVALESANLPHALRIACDDAYREWHALLTERLSPLQPDAARAGALATLILAAVEGGLVLSKARRDTSPLRDIGRQLDALLRSLSSARSRRGVHRPARKPRRRA